MSGEVLRRAAAGLREEWGDSGPTGGAWHRERDFHLAVANLLDSLAEHVESHDCEAHCEPFGCQPVLEATELARAYLGADA